MTDPCSVVFRVDESVRVGRGHMSRSLALAEVLLGAGAQVSFWCLDILSATKSALQRRGIQVVELMDDDDFLDRDWTDKIVIVDGYQFGDIFWQRLRDSHPRRTVCIDELRGVRYVADLLICYNDGVNEEQFDLAPYTRLLLGGRYLLLRNEIHDAARLMDRPTPRRAVMLAAGGTRQESWVTEILSYLRRVDPIAILWVLSGRRLPAGKVARRAGICRGRVRFFSGLKPAEILRLFRRAKYLVTPASTVMLEAFAVGCPIVSGWVAENQRNSLDFYERKGLIINMGDLRRLNPSRLEKDIDRARRVAGRMIRRQRTYIAASRGGLEEIVRAVLTSDNVA